MICISHLEHFELHHLPNAYLNRLGLNEEDHRLQVSALLDVLQGKLSKHELFLTEKPIATPAWDKDYYEPCRTDLLGHIPPEAGKILCVGCGSGTTEAHLMATGKKVTALPLDLVIGQSAQQRHGVRLLPPDFSEAFELLGDERFDAVLLGDILQHLKHPVDILTRLGRHLEPRGVIVGSVPNFGVLRRVSHRFVAKNHKWASVGGHFADTALHLTSSRTTRKWLKASGLQLADMRFDGRTAPSWRWGCGLPGEVVAPSIVFVARSYES
jgi:2-polyprenyl-3-methyl-5-hydroxy-6-metoxy-1,4-benzoquinol methylase